MLCHTEKQVRFHAARVAHVNALAEAAETFLRSTADDCQNSHEGIALRQILREIAMESDPRPVVIEDAVAYYVNEDGSRQAANDAYPRVATDRHDPVLVEHEGREFEVTFMKGCMAFSVKAVDGCGVPDHHAIAELARPLACC